MARTLTERDREVIWHPYTQHKNPFPPIAAVRGKGSLLFDEKGNSYIDAISSWWVTIHGHGHPYIAEKVYEQARTLEHVIFTGFTHEPAVQLAERLLPLLPGSFSKVFYSDNGSTAVEVAIKMAIQYWRNQGGGQSEGPGAGAVREPGTGTDSGRKDGRPKGVGGRNKILVFRNSYHGDTFGAMSVSERSVFTASFQDYLFEVIFIETPTASNIEELKAFIRQQGPGIACFLYEPLLQAAGGMRVYEADLMDQLLDVVQSEGILCMADEVLTGFGRTGKLFAGEYLRNKADIICLSKGLTGGTMALGVTATTERVFEAFLSDDKRKTLFHGHSFTANPLACSASLASLDLLLEEGGTEQRQAITRQHREFGERIKRYAVVKNLRVLGTIIAFDVQAGEDGYINSIGADITRESMQNGIYLRPLGNTVYILPPYCITGEELQKIYTFLEGFLESLKS